MLASGSTAPDFSLPDQDGNRVQLGELRGRWVALWWYPKASTPG
jgi:peroxiredoxin Q/BCP